ncbi:hypothetical protein BDZ85DRAFT_285286 [Elsinoe ampelina]|uniref:protein-histidine N-methyltransferase n=1 Tax=Elsinoe ampelina TaxID=302913 RepID=A0A6A6G125_9PEZI|nr:hypothetical protein BDZ85DRAFT_285286 [Elsinoe ampelina]
MSFAFNFSGDDIDPDEDESASQGNVAASSTILPDAASNVPVQEHSLSEWLPLLPSRLSYATTPILSPSGQHLPLPRRELFDIRQQLMAEDNHALLTSLSTSDISSQIYEGGFKTWECSLDLASLLLDRCSKGSVDGLDGVANVVELGAGSALPTLVLFQLALADGRAVKFTVADFNADVLRLVSLPNLLLAWAKLKGKEGMEGDSGDLDVTEELVREFEGDLRKAGVEVKLLSGPWGGDMVKLMPQSVEGKSTLVLAAETIYSPASLQSFVDLVHGVLRGGATNKAYVAAKKFYFGVGGSVDALKASCREKGLTAAEVETTALNGMEEGVGRAIVEVQLSK